MYIAHVVITAEEKVVDGRSAILFATVAGVSLGLMTGGAKPRRHDQARAQLAILVRGTVLVLLGTLLSLLQPPLAVILDYYGFAFVLLTPVLFLPRRALAVIALAAAIASPLAVAALRENLDFARIVDPLQPLARWLVFGEYPVLIWLAFLLIGLILARSDLRRRRTALLALGGGTLAAALGYGSAAVIPNLSAAAHSGTTAEVVGSGGVAVATIGLLALLDLTRGVVVRILRVVAWPVAAAGAMSLTLYTAHVVVLTAIARGLPDDSSGYPAWVLPGLIVGSVAIASVWRRFVGSGPLEAGLRALTRLVLLRPDDIERGTP